MGLAIGAFHSPTQDAAFYACEDDVQGAIRPPRHYTVHMDLRIITRVLIK